MAQSPGLKTSVARASGRALHRLMQLVWRTSDRIMEPEDATERFISEHPAIVAVWHGQFMMLAAFNPKELPVSAMVARHTDAEVIAEALRGYNIELVRGAGSQGRKFKMSRGGVHALRAAVRALQDGRSVVMTADVPPGPARRAGAGIITLAKLSGRPILPAAVASSRFKALNTWSRATFNLPYSKLACVVGEPISVPGDADDRLIEHKRQDVENALNVAMARAYELAGADMMRVMPPDILPEDAPVPKPGLKLNIYRQATNLARPLVPVLLKMRQERGKEDASRKSERYGVASAERPEAPVVWVHAASVGETNAVLPVIDALLTERQDLFVVLTTGTVTSADIAASRLNERARHQFVPLDSPAYARRFLDHWQPALAIFTESEIWPNLILETHARAIPLALVNARMSASSHRRWAKSGKLSVALFSRFNRILAQNEVMARRFKKLGARTVINAGNLKADAPPPPVDAERLAELKAVIASRPVFVAASTHNGEEQAAIEAHRALRSSHPDVLTIIAPRHPERGTLVREQAEAAGLKVRQRSLNEKPGPGCDLYVADTIGELGVFYALADAAFIGGSLIERGGQNPLEAIAIETPVLTGPSQHNFRDTYQALLAANAVVEVRDAKSLASEVSRLLASPDERKAMSKRATLALHAMQGALEMTVAELLKLLEKREQS